MDLATIAEMTPGPIAINGATFVGLKIAGLPGAVIATLGCITPSLIIVSMFSFIYRKYRELPILQSTLASLRPAVVGLLAAATLLLCNTENFSTPMDNPWQFFISCALFAATAFGTGYLKINPIRMICYAAFAGLLLFY